MIKAVIFDMDGTIVETSMKHDLPVWSEILKDYGVDLTLPVFQAFLGKKASEILRQFTPHITDEQIEKSMEKRNILLIDSIEKYGLDATPGLFDFLKRLQKSNYKLALATGAGQKKVDIVFDHVPLRDYFSVIVTADDVKHGKPNPEVFLQAAQKLGVEPKNCLVIEDAHNGIEAAHKAAMKAVVITTTHTKEELTGADKIIDSFDELTDETLKTL